MRNYLIALIVIVILLGLGCQSRSHKILKNDLGALIDSIRLSEIKDQRTELFQIEVDSVDSNYRILGKVDSERIYSILASKLEPLEYVKNRIRLVPDTAVGLKKYGLCTISVGNIRSEPKHSAELSSQILLGHVVRILDKKEDWLQVQTLDNYIGWIDQGAIVRLNRNELEEWDKNQKVIVKKPYTMVFSQVTPQTIVSDLVLSNVLQLLGARANDSILVRLPDGRQGLVGSDDVQVYEKWQSTLKADRANIGQSAMRYLGIPYLWGGTSIKGMDCSGFTKGVYFSNGIVLDRDASQQATEGIKVDSTGNFDKLQTGDLVFFGNKNGKVQKVTHVGIILEKHKFIHASGDGYVKINSLESGCPLYTPKEHKRYLFARRYIVEDSIINKFPEEGMYKAMVFKE